MQRHGVCRGLAVAGEMVWLDRFQTDSIQIPKNPLSTEASSTSLKIVFDFMQLSEPRKALELVTC